MIREARDDKLSNFIIGIATGMKISYQYWQNFENYQKFSSKNAINQSVNGLDRIWYGLKWLDRSTKLVHIIFLFFQRTERRLAAFNRGINHKLMEYLLRTTQKTIKNITAIHI